MVYGVLAAVVAVPVAGQRALAGVSFEDRLGSLPVEVSLTHNGVSTLDTGILGRLYWDRTGTAGFGARVRVTGPPEADGSLASYVSPTFVQANAQFVNDPGEVARAYGGQLQRDLWSHFLWIELWAGLVGGALLTAVFRARSPIPTAVRTRTGRVGLAVALVGLGVTASAATAYQAFLTWDGSTEIGASYPMPGISQLSFSNAQALEIARQVQPFIEKNTVRIEERSALYAEAVAASARAELPLRAEGLRPREGEVIVLAEADPQGSLVGTRVRRELYPLLHRYLGEDAFALRTISGDVTSNGTVAEVGFVRGEAAASPGIPVVAVKGDHDTDTTVEQLADQGVVVPDLETSEVSGLRVAAANDPAFKALFGGLVINESGTTETALGQALRDEVDDADPVIVLLHQPRSALGYLGIDTLDDLRVGEGRETVPWDDEIPDLPPGSVNIGHLHDADGPWVVWNTDGDEVTWTVVSQLGTSGGVEETPTFNRFSTPFSVPLKSVSVQLQYVNTDSGLQTGYAPLDIATDGKVTVGDRVDLGLPGGQPLAVESFSQRFVG